MSVDSRLTGELVADLDLSGFSDPRSNGPVLFYCVNTSYPMDNSLSGQRRPARQTSEKDVLCFHQQAGP